MQVPPFIPWSGDPDWTKRREEAEHSIHHSVSGLWVQCEQKPDASVAMMSSPGWNASLQSVSQNKPVFLSVASCPVFHHGKESNCGSWLKDRETSMQMVFKIWVSWWGSYSHGPSSRGRSGLLWWNGLSVWCWCSCRQRTVSLWAWSGDLIEAWAHPLHVFVVSPVTKVWDLTTSLGCVKTVSIPTSALVVK